MNIFRTIRNNWKKSVVGTGLLIYTADYLYDRNKKARLYQAYCVEAFKYSKEKVPPTQKIRRVTVFLNPISNNERGKSLFEKYVAPMLHLSGLDVRIIRLDSKNEAKQYMEVIDDKDTDCIIIAGGNRTITEALSGLLNRADIENIFSRIKLGILPLGENNSFFENLFKLSLKEETIKLLGDATLAIIKGETSSIDLMKVSFQDTQNSKSIYALSNVSYGYSSDKQASLDQYWWYGPFKNHMNNYYEFRRAYFNKSESRLEFCYKCDGCKNCFKAKNFLKDDSKINDDNQEQKKQTILQSLLVLFYKKIISSKEKAESERKRMLELKYESLKENPDCGVRHDMYNNVPTQLNAQINQRNQINAEASGVDFTISKLPGSLFKAENLKPTENKLKLSNITLTDFKNAKSKLIIDNEIYDLEEKEGLTNVKIEYLNKPIKFLIDLNMNNDDIMKKNDNTNIYLADYYVNNSINFKNGYLNTEFIEPFKKYYYWFWNKN